MNNNIFAKFIAACGIIISQESAVLANSAHALDAFDRHDLFSEQMVFSGITSLQINSDSGVVRIQPSLDSRTVV